MCESASVCSNDHENDVWMIMVRVSELSAFYCIDRLLFDVLRQSVGSSRYSSCDWERLAELSIEVDAHLVGNEMRGIHQHHLQTLG